MSLITCCPSCGTKFRVVADQLRISDGWVRCGRCQEVFDASQALERSEVVASPTPQVLAPEPSASELLASETSVTEEALRPTQQAHTAAAELMQKQTVDGYVLPAPDSDAHIDEVDIDQALWAMAPGKESFPARHESSVPAANPPEPMLTDDSDMPARDLPPAVLWEPLEALPAEEAQAQPWEDVLQSREPALDVNDVLVEEGWLPLNQAEAAVQAAEPAVSPESAAWPSVADIEVGPGPAEASAEEVPSFVRQAQRRAWWNQPAVRFVMGMLVTLLPLALALQIALHERNTLVAWKPQWRPAFESMCIALRCELAPRRHIASVVITGSSFHEDAQPHHYRLGLSLQNQSITSVATPAVELTLTDSQDQVLVRKVLLPTDIGAPTELAAHSEWTGALNVATQGLLLQVSGYRVMAFYP